MRSSLLAAGLLATALVLTACKSDPPKPPDAGNPVLSDTALSETTVGASYFTTLNSSGGKAPYTFSAQGLPPGITLANNGALSGGATTAGDYQVQVTVSDADGKQASKAIALKVYAAVSFKQNTLPQATAEAPYSATLEFEGGKAPLTLRMTRGDLPPGVSFNATSKQLSGTFSSAGTLALTFEAMDIHGAKATQNYTVGVAEPLRLTATLPAGNVGQLYSQSLTATGGRAPLTLSVASGALPPGLTLSNGVISGTPATSGTFSLGVNVTDANGASVTANITLDIHSHLPPQLPAATLPNGIVGKEYSELLLGTNGAPPYTFTISSGALPAGLTLSAAGLISGTPTAAETQSFLVTLTDTRGQKAQRGFTLITFPQLVVQTTALAEGYQGQFYNQTLLASGGKTPYRWEAQGSLPTGLNLTTAGILSGTPTVAGSYGLTFSLTDGSGQQSSGAFQLTLYTLPVITTAVLADGAVGVAYNQRLRASGGKPPYTFAITGGVLPPGLQLTGDTLNGTPTVAVSSNITVQVTDANGKASSKDLDVRIFNGLTITTGTVDDAYVGRSYAMTLTAVGGDTSKPYTWTTIGALPAGLSMTPAGIISGTATTAGTVRFTAQVTDNSGTSITRVFDLRVLAQPSVSTASLPEAFEGVAYSATLSGADGLPPYQWRLSAGSLPAGLTLSSSGVLNGTPTAAGTASFTVELTDSNNVKATRALSLTVSTLTITNTAMDDGYASQPYTYTLTATGGPTPFTWNVTGLPAGLTYDTATGVVSGTPAASGTTSVTVRVTDAAGRSFNRSLSLTLYGLPQITTATLAEGATNVAYTQPLDATNGKPPYTWSLTSGTLHAGLAFNQNAGVWAIRGTATESGTRTLTFRVTDANGKSASRSLDLTILSPLVLVTTALPDAYVGKAYDQSLTAAGGKPGYAFDRSAGALPGGLSLSTTGRISGTVATGATTSTFTARVTDTNNSQATRELSIAVYQAPAITTASYADGYIGEAYTGTTAATGGKAPLTWSLAAGTLPTGVGLDPSTGQLVGSPTQAGTFTFTVKVRDVNGEEATRPLQVIIHTPPVVTSGSPLPGAYIGEPYAVTISATGGKAPLAFTVTTGTLPQGLQLATDGSLGGVVSATIAHATKSTFTVKVTDANGRFASKPFELTSYKQLQILSTSLVTGTEGVDYRRSEANTERLAVQFGQVPLTFAATGLPPGLTLSPTTGELTGTPDQGSANSYSVAFTVTDAGNRITSKTLPLTVVAPKPINYGGVSGLAPGGSRITQTLTVFTVTGRRPLAGVGVRVRKNGVEYSPVKEALTNAEGKVVFTGLGLNGTTDTVDITANGKELVNTTLAGVNASLVTLTMSSIPVPGPRVSSGGAYDPISRRFLISSGYDSGTSNSLFYTSCLNDMVEMTDVAQKTFVTRVPGGLTTSPSPRYEASMAVASGVAVFFGGRNCIDTGDALGDTWEYTLSTNTWTQVNPATRPGPRRGAALVRESSGNSVILVGGYRVPSYSNEVWRYTPANDTWSLLGTAPINRAWMGAATNTNTGELWFCGGRGAIGTECESFNPVTQAWTTRPSLPTARSEFSMAYDPVTDTFYAFGGRTPSGTPFGDLLMLPAGAAAWTSVVPAGATPLPRYGHVMYFDLTRRELVVALGLTRDPGSFRTTRLGDVWTYNGTAWTERGTPPAPLPGYTVSGDIFNGPLFGVAEISLVTSSGFSTSTSAALDGSGHGTYTLAGIPPGERAFMTVLGKDYNLLYPNDLWSYAELEFAPLTGNTPANFVLPTGPAVVLRATGQLLLPPSWHGQAGTTPFGEAYVDVPGFPYLPNGEASPNTPNKQFDLAFFPTAAPKSQRVLSYAASQLACEDHGLYGLMTPGNKDLTLGGNATGVTPGQAECIPAGPRGIATARHRAFFFFPERAAVADLDGDTLSDVVLASTTSDSVNILWGDAEITSAFPEEDCCDVDGSHSAAIGDFNKDGRPDLAFTEWPNDQVKVKLARNDVPRAFGPATAYPVGFNPTGISTADANQDGFLDLAVANEGSNTVSFLPGLAGGTFGAAQTINIAGTMPTTVLLTNVDGDNRPDLVVLTSEGVSLALDGSVQGPFGNSALLVAGSQPSSVVVGKLNGDNLPDIAVTNAGSNTVSLFFGTGNGAFAAPVSLNTGGVAPADLVLADLNGDTHLDLAVASPSDGTITLLQGASNGTFTVHSRVPVRAPRTLVALDFNGDTLNDLVTLSPNANSVYILPGQKPLPTAPGNTFSFMAPAKAGFMWSMHRINGQRRYWDYFSPLQAGPVSYSLPLASTLAPSSAPVAPASGKVELTWTPYVHKWEPDSVHPFNPRQFLLSNLGKDSDTQPGASHYLWP